MEAPLCLWQFRQQEDGPRRISLGDSLRTPAARDQLFEDVESCLG